MSIAYYTVFVYKLYTISRQLSSGYHGTASNTDTAEPLSDDVTVPFLAVGHHITRQVNESAMFNSPKLLLILHITAPGVMELHC